MEHISSWGKSAAINMYECDHDRLTDPELLKEYVRQVIDVVGMQAHGPCHVDRFGEGDLEGYSAMQFIKTSSIIVHLDETGNRAFVDVFTCKDFDPDAVEEFSKTFFGAKRSAMTVLDR